MTNDNELFIGTDPYKKDTDNDGIDDYTELMYRLNPDTDWDTLSDYDEIYLYGTNPLIPDSDTDGINDGSEIN